MATNRRRRVQERRLGTSSPRLLYLLLSGIDFEFLDPALGPDHGRNDSLPEELLAEAWDECREQVMAWLATGEEPVFAFGMKSSPLPNARPWAWWRFDAEVPEPRPEVALWPDRRMVREPGGEWEPEAEYLSRYGLLRAAR